MNKEIKSLNSTGFTRILKTDQKNGTIEILFYDISLNMKFIYTSPNSNNFQKKNIKITKTGVFDINILIHSLSNFPLIHQKLT